MKRRRLLYLLSAIFSALLILPWGLTQPSILDDMRNFVFDRFQRAAPRPYDREAPVRVVAIDDESLADPYLGQWPWPRTKLAELTDKLAKLGAACIAFDVIFAEADRLSFEKILPSIPSKAAQNELAKSLGNAPTNDQVFATSISAAPVVLGMTLLPSGKEKSHPRKAGLVFAGDDPAPFLAAFRAVVTPIGLLTQAAHGMGATNWLPDHDQIVRRVPLFASDPSGPAPSLALEALRVAQNETTYVIRSSNASGETAAGRQTGVNAIAVGSIQIVTGANADIRPRYAYSGQGRVVSASAVMRDQVDRSEIEGRIVFIGALAAGLGDVRATPLEATVPGVEIHAQIIEALLSGQLLSRPDWAAGAEFFVALALFVCVVLLGLAGSPLISALFVALAIGSLFLGSYYLFEKHALLLDPVYPSASIVGVYGVGAITLWQFERLAKRHVHVAFGKFLSPSVVDRLAENPERLTLGGETRELTVLFSDLRNFSTLSEGMTAQELTQFMNDYLTPMTDAILDREGTVDKYIGDAIMAFWNAPLDIPQHPQKAVAAALAMRDELVKFNEARAAKAREAGVAHRIAAMGVGINLGPCSVGNMGSNRRFDYSVLGDAVNLASRLEGVSKILKVDILVSGAVRQAAGDFAWLDLGEVVVVGRQTPTAVSTVAGDAALARSAEFSAWRARHEEMRAKYESRRFEEAAGLAATLAAAAPDRWRGLYGLLRERFIFLSRAELPENWSPVWVMESKSGGEGEGKASSEPKPAGAQKEPATAT
jgi:adenylate cyclase